jgi:hypothetical protein
MNLNNFRIAAGEDRTLSLTARDANGAVLVITGGTLEFQLLSQRGGVVIFTATGAIVSGAAGTYTVTLTDGNTENLASGTRWFRVFATVSGTTTKCNEGRILVDGIRGEGTSETIP